MDRHQDCRNVEKETKSQMRKMVVTSFPSQRSGCHQCRLLTLVVGELVQKKSLDFRSGFQALRAWVSLGSDIFAWEIAQCIGREQEIHMPVLKPSQQTRSARLLAILIQMFEDFPRGNTMLQAYVEGVGVDGAFLASRGTSGFEGLRLLAREFSLCSRAEASFF